MWIRKPPIEVTLGRWTERLRALCLDALLGACLWYIFARLFVVLGVLPRHSASACVGSATLAVILPAAWYDNWRARRKKDGTLVCDRCNVVKMSDGQLTCKCGGHYHLLAEMKWVNARPVPTMFIDGITVPK